MAARPEEPARRASRRRLTSPASSKRTAIAPWESKSSSSAAEADRPGIGPVDGRRRRRHVAQGEVEAVEAAFGVVEVAVGIVEGLR